MAADGVTRAACFVTSTYSSWSSCRQYRENLYDAVDGLEGAPQLDKLRHYFNHPGFIEPIVEATLTSLAELPEDVRAGAHLAFVTHSIPLSMNETSGPEGGAYVDQHLSTAEEIARQVSLETGVEQPSGGRAGDIADHAFQRHEPAATNAFAGVVLAGGPAV
eukprot:gene7023-8420_t